MLVGGATPHERQSKFCSAVDKVTTHIDGGKVDISNAFLVEDTRYGSNILE